jgi:hypothetical protein
VAHDQEVMGSNPSTVFWKDVSNYASHYIKKKNLINGSQMGHTKTTWLYLKYISKLKVN